MADLTSMLLEVGTSLEEADMGDSFVDAWTVANKVIRDVYADIALMK